MKKRHESTLKELEAKDKEAARLIKNTTQTQNNSNTNQTPSNPNTSQNSGLFQKIGQVIDTIVVPIMKIVKDPASVVSDPTIL